MVLIQWYSQKSDESDFQGEGKTEMVFPFFHKSQRRKKIKWFLYRTTQLRGLQLRSIYDHDLPSLISIRLSSLKFLNVRISDSAAVPAICARSLLVIDKQDYLFRFPVMLINF